MSRRPGPINHGTVGGYQTHRNRGEYPCLDCTEARSAYNRARKASRTPDGVTLSIRPGRRPANPKPPTDPWVLRLLDMPAVGAAVARGIRECA